MKCAFQSGIIFLPRKEVANMALYEIKNYIKLLCIRIDHIESYVVDELNTSDEKEINDFIKMYKHRKGLKILIFEMADETHVITYEQMQSFIHTLHVFDYIRQIIENETNKLVVVNDSESPDALQTDPYLHRLLDLGK
jgi:hypothetical protein